MRALLLVLLLANLVFYGAVNGWLGESVRVAVVPEQREPTRVAQQMAASHLELLVPKTAEVPNEAAGAVSAPGAVGATPAGTTPAATTPAGAAPAPAVPAGVAPAGATSSTAGAAPAAAPTAPTPAAAAPATANTPAAPAPTVPAVAAAPATGAASCLELSGLVEDDAKRVAERVRTDRLASLVAVKPATETPTWMVYMPAYASRAEAERVASDLRKKGFEDFFVIQDNSSMRNAISLGIFSSEDGAQGRVASLTGRGFKGAKVVARTSGVTRARVEIREVGAAARTALAQLAKEFPGNEWRTCPAPAAARKG